MVLLSCDCIKEVVVTWWSQLATVTLHPSLEMTTESSPMVHQVPGERQGAILPSAPAVWCQDPQGSKPYSGFRGWCPPMMRGITNKLLGKF